MEEPQKLFRLPGTIEEEEEHETDKHGNNDNQPRSESPLLSQKQCGNITVPRNVTLVRVSTQSSSIGGVGRQDSNRSRYRSGPARKIRRRAVLKNGECNVLQSRISRRSLRFLQDIFTTLVDTQWRWTLLCFSLSFVLSWLGFAVIWWLIAFTHGDFDEKHLPPYQDDWQPCITNIFSFTSCFLFSIETQHTIGYGSRSTTEECPEAIFVMCIQSISGVMIQAFMVGIVFAKMSRPKQRTQTLLFSRNAVICQRDSELCLMFRVADMRKSHIIGATVRSQIIRARTTKEGEILSQNQQELNIGTDGNNGNIFFIWPMTIIHRLNSESPLYNMSAEDMLSERFEIVVILEGTIESTGQTTQARSSYLPQEILWGHRFEPMVSYSKERQGYEVDHSLFNTTTQVDTPLCSGRELAEFYRVQDELRHGNGFVIDDDGLSMEPYHDIHHHYSQSHSHRHPGIIPSSMMRTESTKSDNSLEEHNFGRIIRDNHHRIPSPHFLPPQNNRDSQYRVVEVDPDAIHVIGDIELQQLPEAVNREILKNSREIVYEEETRDELTRDENFVRSLPARRAVLRYPLLDEERRSLNGSRRNLNHKNFPHIDEEKRSLNGSRRNLSSSRKYILVPIDKPDCCNCSSKNLCIGSRENLNGSRRHTGSREYLNVMKRNINSVKCTKEITDIRAKRHLPSHIDIESDKSKKITNINDVSRQSCTTIPLPSSDSLITHNDIIVTMPTDSVLTPESGFAESPHSSSSPESSRKDIRFSHNSIILKNRRSYENAQLQDVNHSIIRTSSSSSTSDSDVTAKDNVPVSVMKNHENDVKQTVSHTSV